MFELIITTGNYFTDGAPETMRVISRHRTLKNAERALDKLRLHNPLLALNAAILEK